MKLLSLIFLLVSLALLFAVGRDTAGASSSRKPAVPAEPAHRPSPLRNLDRPYTLPLLSRHAAFHPA